MKFFLKKSSLKRVCEFVYISWLIICSGSQYFRNFNSFYTNLILFLLAGIYFIFFSCKISQKNLLTLLIIACILIINGIINHNNFSTTTFVIFIITCIALLVIQSDMSVSDFKKYYVYFMIGEALLSLICFLICSFFDLRLLPGYFEQKIDYARGGYNIIYLTPYYTIGWLSTNGFFGRNAGIFWEPGAHAIYLNIAILFIFYGAFHDICPKLRNASAGLLMLTVVTTASTTGYLSLILILLSIILNVRKKSDFKKSLFIVLAVIISVTISLIYGDVFDKLIYRNGSFVTRYNDTFSGMKVALQSGLLGKGLFTDLTDILAKAGIFNISNGLIEFMIRGGILMSGLYLIMIHLGLMRLFNLSGLQLFIVDAVFFLFINSESLTLYPVFVSLLFSWRKENKTVLFFSQPRKNLLIRRNV